MGLPLTLALSPQAGRGDPGGAFDAVVPRGTRAFRLDPEGQTPARIYVSEQRVAALDLSWFGGASSTLRAFTTPSSTIIE